MKELYISPELEILLFAPLQNIAGNYDENATPWSGNNYENGLDSNGEAEGDYSETVDPGEDL